MLTSIQAAGLSQSRRLFTDWCCALSDNNQTVYFSHPTGMYTRCAAIIAWWLSSSGSSQQSHRHEPRHLPLQVGAERQAEPQDAGPEAGVKRESDEVGTLKKKESKMFMPYIKKSNVRVIHQSNVRVIIHQSNVHVIHQSNGRVIHQSTRGVEHDQ